MLSEINVKILDNFVILILFDVAEKYIFRFTKDGKKPPKLIKEYLENSVKLLNKYKTIELSKMKDAIEDINSKEQKEFNKLFVEYKDYQELCQELNFAYLLMIDEDLQKKTIELIYNNIYEYQVLVKKDLITSTQVSISNVIEKSKIKKINKLHYYKNQLSSNYLNV